MPKGLIQNRMLRGIAAAMLGFLHCVPVPVSSQVSATAPVSAISAPASGSPASPAQAVLPQKEIRNAYSDGDFDGVIVAIDSFTQAHQSFSRNDSVFIAKYLAVIYTANPLTREKGKHYMFRLLDLQPSAKIVDMFASDEILRIFENVKEEFLVRRETLKEDKLGESGSQPPAMRKKGVSHPLYWIAGGITVAALGGTAIYLLQPEKSSDKVYELPE